MWLFCFIVLLHTWWKQGLADGCRCKVARDSDIQVCVGIRVGTTHFKPQGLHMPSEAHLGSPMLWKGKSSTASGVSTRELPLLLQTYRGELCTSRQSGLCPWIVAVHQLHGLVPEREWCCGW